MPKPDPKPDAGDVPTPRTETRHQVTIAVDCSTKHLFVSNYVSNISKGGLFIRSATPLPMDTEVELRIHLPASGTSLRVKGRVVWNYDIEKGTAQIVPGSGIKFIEIPDQERKLLEDYIDKLEAQSSPSH